MHFHCNWHLHEQTAALIMLLVPACSRNSRCCCHCTAEFYSSQIFRQGVRSTIEPDSTTL